MKPIHKNKVLFWNLRLVISAKKLIVFRCARTWTMEFSKKKHGVFQQIQLATVNVNALAKELS